MHSSYNRRPLVSLLLLLLAISVLALFGGHRHESVEHSRDLFVISRRLDDTTSDTTDTTTAAGGGNQEDSATTEDTTSSTSFTDDDGFYGYVPKANDPGTAMLISTLLFCILSNAILPCLVTFGRRYEKRRMAYLQHKENEKVEPQEDTTNKPEENNEKQQSVIEDGVSVTLSSFMHGKLNTKQTSTIAGKPANVARNIFDRIVMPPYPDDRDGSALGVGNYYFGARSMLSGVEKQSNVSNAESHHSYTSAVSHATTTLLDAAPRKRARGYARQRRALMDRARWMEDVRKEKENDKEDLEKHSEIPGITASELLASARTNLQAATLSQIAGNELVKANIHASEQTAQHQEGDLPGTREIVAGSEVASRVSSSNRYGRGRRRRRGGPASSVLSFASKRSGSPEPSVMSKLEDYVVSPMDAPDAHDPGRPKPVTMAGEEELDLCCGEHAWWRPAMIARGLDAVATYGEWDREMRRIVAISVTFSIEGFLGGLFDVLTVAIVASYIGTDSVAAFTIIDLILGLPTEFFGGFQGAIGCLCPQAYGGDNDRLAGQYVQIGAVLYVTCMIPTAILGIVFSDDIMKLLGFDAATRTIARDYAPYFMLEEIIGGLSDCYHELLEVIGREKYCTIIGILEDLVAFIVVLLTCLTRDNTTLTDVGIIHLTTCVFFTLFSVAFVVWQRWMEPFHRGIFHTWAFGNRKAVRIMIRTALPLSFGYLLQYGEWEVLTIFSAFMGPAEVAAWGILGTLWESFEAMVEGVADGGEIRVGYHLGAGRPARAKGAAYKALLVGVLIGSIFTSIVFIFGENLAIWFSTDPALQHIIADLLPFLGIGNIFLTAGIVAYGIVGAQGRYRLANTIAFVSSILVTLPLAAIFTYGLNFDLKGITSAVVIGYSITNTALLYILVRSDWDRLSKIIVDMHDAAAGHDIGDDDPEEELLAGNAVPS